MIAWVAAVAAVAALVAGCGSSRSNGPLPLTAAETARRVTTAAPASTAPPSTAFDRTEAEKQVRAAYQNFRVKLRELTFHPDPNSPLIDQIWTGTMADQVRASQQKSVSEGWYATPSKRSKWQVETVTFSSPSEAVVRDCYINGDLAWQHGKLKDDSVGAHETQLGFVRVPNGWRLRIGDELSYKRGVVTCESGR